MTDLFKELREKSVRHVLASSFIFLVAGVALICVSGIQNFPKMLHPADLETAVLQENMEGTYAEGDIDFLYGEYMDTANYKNGVKKDVSSVSMVICPGLNGYIGMEIPKNQIATYEGALETCYDNWDDDSYVLDPDFHVSGTIVRMSSEEQQIYQDFLLDAGADAYDTETFAPYVLKVGYLGNDLPLTMFLIFGLGVLLVMIFAVQLVRAFRGYYQKDLDAFIAQSSDPEEEYRKLNELYHTAAPINGIYANDEYVLFQDGRHSRIRRPWDIVWIYKEVTRHRVYGLIPAGSSYGFNMFSNDGKIYSFAVGKNNIDEVLNALSEALPGAVMGYSAELLEQYHKDRSLFSQKWNELRK
ncbi:MAG: hypothetical protein LKF53_07540 [Solobacterium sp.]|jgi:hypothetical protein|nr:hypothetical protein [Solobacterium sp.]MCH4206227.1 hypothetical protein [Solobacterium sp.]MCH4227716.1 hypothetical protein [Solobacterium sp.]MCH4283143.1 hypothetical protein [Solobacterium sp.]